MSDAPYPGLRPFRPDEVDIFFGREAQIDQLLTMLGRRRFLAVVGESGCGKSSLVRAGMIPALESGLLAAAGARWRVASMRPGEAPLAGLAAALVEPAALGPERAGQPGAEAFLYATLRRGPLGLMEALSDTPLPPRTNLLVLVDQFEEIFRYRRHGDRHEADTFVALMLASAARAELPVYVVLTMRSDFLGECALFAGLPEALNDSQFLTPRMSRRERREAIVGPAGVFAAEVEPELVNRLLNDMGAEPDQLPLMQHVLMRMWTRVAGNRRDGSVGTVAPVRLGVAEYEAAGGFANALSRHADEAFEGLSPAGQRVAEVMFCTLSERGHGGRDTRRPARLAEVALVAAVDPVEVMSVVEAFRRPDRSLLTPPPPSSLAADTVLDISHETLIRQWHRLARWVDDEAESAATYRRLVETARLWRSGQAGLWGSPDLDLALAWQDERRPSEAWASRYGGDLDLATEFLAASQSKRQAEEAATENTRLERERRVRRRSTLLAIGLIVALGLTGLAALGWSRAAALARVARAELLISEAAGNARNRPQRSLLLAAEAAALTPDVASGSAREVSEQLQATLSELGGKALAGHGDEVRALAFTPDGRRLVTGSDDGTARLWDLTDLSAAPVVLDHGGEAVRRLAVARGGRWLATAGRSKRLRLWDLTASDLETSAPRVVDVHQDSILALAISPDGRWLASGSEDHVDYLWDLEAQDMPPVRLPGANAEITCVAFSPDSRFLAAGGEDNTARLWDVQSSRSNRGARILAGHSGTILAVAFSSDGKWLATASEDNTARLWPLAGQTGGPRILAGHRSSVTALKFSPDGKWLATGSRDNEVRLWELAGAQPATSARFVLAGHEAPISSLAVSPDSSRLVSASWDGSARIWNLTAAEPGASAIALRGHDGKLHAVAISPDGRIVATASADGSARLWPLAAKTVAPVTVLGGHLDAVQTVVVSPDGRWVVSASVDNTARLWNAQAASFSTDSTLLAGHQSSITAAAISPDGRWLATGSNDNTARLWLLTDQHSPPMVLSGHEASITALAFTADGHWLITGSRDETIRLWPMTVEAPANNVAILRGHRDSVIALAVSPDGRWLATGSEDGTARLWDLASHSRAEGSLVLTGHEGKVTALAFSLDSGRLATGSQDSNVLVWRLASPGEAPLRLVGHEEAISAVLFTRDGHRVVTGSKDDSVRVWDLAAPDPARRPQVLRGHSGSVTALTVIPGTSLLASGSEDGTARLWELGRSPIELRGVLRGHAGPLTSIAADFAGGTVVTGSEDHTARVWRLDLWSLTLPELVAAARTTAGRELTPRERLLYAVEDPNSPAQR